MLHRIHDLTFAMRYGTLLLCENIFSISGNVDSEGFLPRLMVKVMVGKRRERSNAVVIKEKHDGDKY